MVAAAAQDTAEGAVVIAAGGATVLSVGLQVQSGQSCTGELRGDSSDDRGWRSCVRGTQWSKRCSQLEQKVLTAVGTEVGGCGCLDGWRQSLQDQDTVVVGGRATAAATAAQVVQSGCSKGTGSSEETIIRESYIWRPRDRGWRSEGGTAG